MPTISTVTPSPLIAGTTETITGPDVGICSNVVLSVQTPVGDGTNAVYLRQLAATLTRVNQNTATFVMPDFELTASTGGTIRARYTIDGITSSTVSKDVTLDPIPDTEPPAEPPAPTYGYDIADGPMDYPLARVPWSFHDPLTGDSYSLPINPNKMTSPFPTKTINAQFTTAVDGQQLVTEGSPKAAQWQFSGEIFNASHYDALRSWVYERNRRIIVVDHFGRPITCVLMFFDVQPKQVLKKYWRHQYTITALVLNVGEPTEVPT